MNVESKEQSGNGCTYTNIHQISRNCLNKRLLARKHMATVFWDRKRMVMVEFMQQGTTTTSEVYC
jgi:hypothetical protein